MLHPLSGAVHPRGPWAPRPGRGLMTPPGGHRAVCRAPNPSFPGRWNPCHSLMSTPDLPVCRGYIPLASAVRSLLQSLSALGRRYTDVILAAGQVSPSATKPDLEPSVCAGPVSPALAGVLHAHMSPSCYSTLAVTHQRPALAVSLPSSGCCKTSRPCKAPREHH